MGFRSLTFTKERDQQQLRGMYVHALCVMPVWVVLRCLQYSMARAILVIVIVRQTVQNYWKRWYFCLVDLQSLEPVPCGSNTPHLVYLLSTILYNYLKITTSWTDSCQDSKIARIPRDSTHSKVPKKGGEFQRIKKHSVSTHSKAKPITRGRNEWESLKQQATEAATHSNDRHLATRRIDRRRKSREVYPIVPSHYHQHESNQQ